MSDYARRMLETHGASKTASEQQQDDDTALFNNMQDTGPTADQYIRSAIQGEEARRRAGGSMMIDGVDYGGVPAPPSLTEPSPDAIVTDLDADPQPTMPVTDLERAPVRDVFASQLTSGDIEELAKSRTFPRDLELSEQEKERSLFGIGPAPVSIQEQYEQIPDALDRMIFLKNRRDQVVSSRVTGQQQAELLPQLAEAAQKGLYVAGGITAVTRGIPGLVNLVRTTPKEVLVERLTDLGVDLVFAVPLLNDLYQTFTDDDEPEQQTEAMDMKPPVAASKNEGSQTRPADVQKAAQPMLEPQRVEQTPSAAKKSKSTGTRRITNSTERDNAVSEWSDRSQALKERLREYDDNVASMPIADSRKMMAEMRQEAQDIEKLRKSFVEYDKSRPSQDIREEFRSVY